VPVHRLSLCPSPPPPAPTAAPRVVDSPPPVKNPPFSAAAQFRWSTAVSKRSPRFVESPPPAGSDCDPSDESHFVANTHAVSKHNPISTSENTRGAAQPFVQLDALRAAPSARKLTQSLGSNEGRSVKHKPNCSPPPARQASSVTPHAFTQPSAWAVRPLAASEPAFVRHRHQRFPSTRRPLWHHRHRSGHTAANPLRQFVRQHQDIGTLRIGWLPSASNLWSRGPVAPYPAHAGRRQRRCQIGRTVRSPSRTRVLPNPSFNLTRSGLRPPRAS
jgi:hypothetical protein